MSVLATDDQKNAPMMAVNIKNQRSKMKSSGCSKTLALKLKLVLLMPSLDLLASERLPCCIYFSEFTTL